MEGGDGIGLVEMEEGVGEVSGLGIGGAQGGDEFRIRQPAQFAGALGQLNCGQAVTDGVVRRCGEQPGFAIQQILLIGKFEQSLIDHCQSFGVSSKSGEGEKTIVRMQPLIAGIDPGI